MDLVREYKGVLIALAALVVLLMASVVQVPETQQAVVVRFGEPIKKINSFDPGKDFGQTGAGLRIKRADLPDGALESAFARMQAARDQEATTIRAQGQKNAQLIRAEAEAQAAQIYAASFGKDPQFYDFYRAMQSYDTTFSATGTKGQSTIILSPDNEYLRQFRGR